MLFGTGRCRIGFGLGGFRVEFGFRISLERRSGVGFRLECVARDRFDGLCAGFHGDRRRLVGRVSGRTAARRRRADDGRTGLGSGRSIRRRLGVRSGCALVAGSRDRLGRFGCGVDRGVDVEVRSVRAREVRERVERRSVVSRVLGTDRESRHLIALARDDLDRLYRTVSGAPRYDGVVP